MLETQIIGIALALGFILLTLELVRQKRLMERYALLWLVVAVVLLALAAWRGLLSTVSFAVGVHYPPALLFAVTIGLALLLLLHSTVSLSSLKDQNKILAQRVGILQRRLEEQEARLAELTGTEPERDELTTSVPDR